MIGGLGGNSPIRTMLTGMSGGDGLQGMLQALGMDQRSAAMQGALKDLSQGNLLGYHKNLFEAATGMDPGRMAGGMLGMGNPLAGLLGGAGGPLGNMLSPFGNVPPSKARGPGKVKYSHTYHDALGNAHTMERRKLGGKGFFGRLRGKMIERRLKNDPAFRARFEAKMGGKVVFDGRNDGKITVQRFTPNIPGLAAGAMLANMAMGGLAQMHLGKSMLANALRAGAMGMMPGVGMGPMGGMQAQSAGGPAGQGAKGIGGGLGANAKPGSAVSKLGPGASVEDLVAAFRVDTEIRNSINSNKGGGAGGAGGASGGRRRRGFGSFLGGIAGIAGKAIGTMYGGPVGGAVGGALGNAVGGAISGGGGGGGGGGAKGAGGAQGGKGGKGADSRNLMFEELKNIMQKISQMQQALSNVLNTMHQGAMNSVRNIRA
jgi:hypothetical protein